MLMYSDAWSKKANKNPFVIMIYSSRMRYGLLFGCTQLFNNFNSSDETSVQLVS